jgi:hypothetical protein
MTNNKEIRNSVIAGVILLPLTLLFEKVRVFFSDITKWFLFSSKSIPIWLVAIFVICTLLCILFLFSKFRSPKWILYKKDNFFDGLIWRWNYSAISNEILNPHPYCPRDDTMLVYTYIDIQHSNTWFNCETCESRYGPYKGDIIYNRERIKRQIDRKIRNGDYKFKITN